MSVDTETISTTDLRLWVEQMEAPEFPCDTHECSHEAVALAIFECGCEIQYCTLHRDWILACDRDPVYAIYCDKKCGKIVGLIRMEPIR